MKTAFAIVALAGLAGNAAAVDYVGAGGAIPDDGGPTNQFSSDIVVGDSFSIADVNVTLNGVNHTWIGDLIVTLSHGGTSVELMNRPGLGVVGAAGLAWDLMGDYGWDDEAGSAVLDFNGGAQDFGATLPAGMYIPENALSAFDGMDVNGTWTLTISDNAFLDPGSIQGWTLSVVPAPSALAMLGLGGLVAGRRRR